MNIALNHPVPLLELDLLRTFVAIVDTGSFAVDDAPGFEGWIVPAAGFSWPATMAAINAVRVRFVAGTGTPAGVRQAILDMVAARYDRRGEGRMLTPGVVADLAPFRRPVVA